MMPPHFVVKLLIAVVTFGVGAQAAAVVQYPRQNNEEHDPDGGSQECREIVSVSFIDGREERSTATVCRAADGRWQAPGNDRSSQVSAEAAPLHLSTCPASLLQAVMSRRPLRIVPDANLSGLAVSHFLVPPGSTFFGQPILSLRYLASEDEEIGEYETVSLTVSGSFATLADSVARRYRGEFRNGTHYAGFEAENSYMLHLLQQPNGIEVRCTDGD